MNPVTVAPAALAQPTPHELALSGYWTALGTGGLDRRQLDEVEVPPQAGVVVDGSGLEALDTVGARLVQRVLERLQSQGHAVELRGWNAHFTKMLELGKQRPESVPTPPAEPGIFERVGRRTFGVGHQSVALLAFIGESAAVLAGSLLHPSRLRWRPVLHNVRTAGFDALPIVGLLSFLLGVVVAYQSATQLRKYGADLFVADLVGLSMMREFAPLITAIIVAGRSGSAYAAQIGTMSVTEEIDALRTIGISPLELLVLPKVLGLVIALPLLTLFADVLGVAGGMIMARAQLGMGFDVFTDRVTEAVSVTSYLIGIGKAPVFAVIISVIGCFQGFRTVGGADSVGRQTTRSVVQSIFLVIVADALFSIAFSFLDL
jgi:phospholipid/cholesterol/gamma-HCH transport system permease protein